MAKMLKVFFLLYFIQVAWGKCDEENCPNMGQLFSCGIVISGTGDNIKCAYMLKARNKYPIQEEACKGNFRGLV